MKKIEKGIPIPPRSNIKYPWGEMEVGDSFFVECEYSRKKHQSIGGSKAQFIRHHKSKCKFTARRVDGGIRVWRIK